MYFNYKSYFDHNSFFPVYVAENMNRDDPGYLPALEKETTILEKRIQACKSRIMMVTCFDVNTNCTSPA